MTKVIHLSSVHRPLDTRIFFKECRTLARSGYDVILIAPGDKDGARESSGVAIKAVPRPHSRFDRMIRTVWRLCRAALKEKGRVYHFHDPELIPVGLWLRLRGVHVIYDVHEDLPRQILSKYWIPEPLRGIVA